MNGFIIHVAETGFKGQWWDFNQAVDEVWNHLQRNPGVFTRFPSLPKSRDEVVKFVDATNALRMLSIRGGDRYVVDEGGGGPGPSFPVRLSNAWRGAAGALENVSDGAAILMEWLGEGAKPVAPEVAERRAAVCAACPRNDKGDWTAWFTEPAANLIRRQLDARREMKLQTSQDAKLSVCSACGCPLQLKVHVPLESVTKRLRDETRAKLDQRCWIVAEEKENV